jgi:hypothetical protein
MSTGTYHLATDLAQMSGLRWPRLLRDSDAKDYDSLDINALVASGDCFITIATSLDDSTKYLKTVDSEALPQIEKAISVLMLLQRHYRIVRKRSEYRQ